MSKLYPLFLFILATLFAATACAEPMPLVATYVPLDTDCEDCLPFDDPPLIAEHLLTFDDELPTEHAADDVEADDADLSGDDGLLRLERGNFYDAEAPSEAGSLSEPTARTERAPKQARLNQLININTATAAELTSLPGIGPALAQRIVDYRQKRPFTEPHHLRRVKGIGKVKYNKLKAHITVGK